MDSRARGWPGKAFEHEADHCEADECGDSCGVAFEVASETTIAADPCECSLDNPSFRQDDEAVKVGSFDDFDLPGASRGYRLRHLWPLVSGAGEYPFDERKAPPDAPQQITCAITVLNIGRQDVHTEQKAERVDEDVALATRDLLARIEALRINRRAPF